MSKKKKTRSFVNEKKPIKRKKAAKAKPVEKPTTVRERIIEEHMKGLETPLIAQKFNVRVNFVTKVLYLHKKSESSIIRPPEPKLNEEEAGLGIEKPIPPKLGSNTHINLRMGTLLKEKKNLKALLLCIRYQEGRMLRAC